MRTRMRGIWLMMAATVFAMGCGDGDNGSARPTSTPIRNVEPSTTPTPSSTPSPTPTFDEPSCWGSAFTSTMRTLAGSDLDAGWTGLWHDSVVAHDGIVTADLNCTGNECTIDGSDLVGQPFGGPLPLSAGGISLCLVSSLREAVTGTYGCEAGCSESSFKLSSRVFLVQDVAKPCPSCVGDPTPNDGVKAGTCSGGSTTPGAACDVNGISDPFPDADDTGMTSNDCLPAGNSVGDLHLDLNPLTTGTVTVQANVDCLSAAFPSGSCFCPNQVMPNACMPLGDCPPSGVCELGPIDGVCENKTFYACRSGTGTEDCEDVFKGAGSCIDRPRPCFGNTITRTGICGTQQSTLVSFFCIPATRAAAINVTIGLPGPGAIALPVSQLLRFR